MGTAEHIGEPGALRATSGGEQRARSHLLVGGVEAEEHHHGSLRARAAGLPAVVAGGRGGYTGAVIAFYSRRLGCLGSVALSLLLTACLIVLFLLL